VSAADGEDQTLQHGRARIIEHHLRAEDLLPTTKAFR
jgi:hypothetical protein